jgi:predicted O-linked N-acetylglucosamine transferase (SPINDLY family)
MRGRHSLAILTMMGITDTVASDVDDYVDLAVRLGRDTSLRREASGRIAANKHRLYGDMESIRALEAFIEGVAARY